MMPASKSTRVGALTWAAAVTLSIAISNSGRGQSAANPLRPVEAPEPVSLAQQPEPPASQAPLPAEPPAAVAGGPAPKPPEGTLTVEELQRRRLALEAATDLDPTVKAELLKQYAKAEEWLQTAAETTRQIAAWNAEIAQAPAATAAAEQQRDQPMPGIELRLPPDSPVQDLQKAPVEDLQKMLEQQQEQLRIAREDLAAREAALKIRERKQELSRLAEEAALQLDELRKKLATAPPAGEAPAQTIAQRTEMEAQAVALDQQLKTYDAETKRLDAVAELLTLQRDLAQRRVTHLEKVVAAWQDAVAQRRKTVAEQKVQQALQVQQQEQAWQKLDPTLEKLGKRNAKLAQLQVELAGKLAEVAKEVEDKAKQLVDVRRDQQNTVDKVEAAGLSSTIGLMLRDQREKLPDVNALRSRLKFIETEMPQTRYNAIDLKEERQRIGDPDASVQDVRAKLTQPMPDDAWNAIEPWVRESLQRQRKTLDDLLPDYETYLDDLSDLEVNTRRLLTQVDEFANYIDERILWIRSTEPLWLNTLADARDGVQKLISAQVWIDAFRYGTSRSGSQPIKFAALLVLWGGLFLLRRVFRNRLQNLERPIDDSLFHGVSANLEAVVLTISIASMWPLFVLMVGWSISQMAGTAEQADPPAPAAAIGLLASLSAALMTTAYVFWPAEMVRQFFRPQGLAVAHLGWDPTTVGMIRRVVKRLMTIGLPLVLLVNFTDKFDDGLSRDSLGRLVFLAAMLLIALMFYREFHPRGVLFESLFYVGAERTSYRRRVALFWLIMAVPLVLSGLSIAGFHYSANQLTARLIESLWFVLAVLFVRSLIARWLFIRQWKLARRLAEERAAEAAEEEEHAPGESDETEESVPDTARAAKRKEEEQTLVRIDQQLQKLLRLGVITALLIGLWMVWSDMLPALRALDRVPVWPFGSVGQETAWLPPADALTPDATAAGAETTEPASLSAAAEEPPIEGTSLGDLLLTLLIAFVTIAAGKNLPGLLEVTLLERLPMDKGARNAVTTISGYAIMLAGLLMGANAIGLRWQSIQWLAAALTVGLGFGLQEIFANFVSGLILLFERPIRVGDIITLGDIDGTVTKIRIRATTITNWDRKELIVPNKELITGRLLNWTLSDHMNRIVVNVGVAYGSNVAKVRRLMLRIANDHPHVLKDPAPIVTFEAFGDSALSFVLRCYLPNLDNRLATIHDLHASIHDRFAREGIEIAFPQLDLHVRSTTPPHNV